MLSSYVLVGVSTACTNRDFVHFIVAEKSIFLSIYKNNANNEQVVHIKRYKAHFLEYSAFFSSLIFIILFWFIEKWKYINKEDAISESQLC